MRDSLAALGRSIVAALRPSSAPWAVGPALWAVGTAALIAGTGVLFGELQFVGLAYLGAACAVVFLVRGFYRARWWAWVAEAIGGAVGISVGAQLWPGFGAGQVLVAAVAGAISGTAGGTGPSAPAFGLMLSVGVAFGQFGGSSLPWWQQAVCYLVGRRCLRYRCWRRGPFIAISRSDGLRPTCTSRRRTCARRSAPSVPGGPRPIGLRLGRGTRRPQPARR